MVESTIEGEHMSTSSVLFEIYEERRNQIELWGPDQSHPDGTSTEKFSKALKLARAAYEKADTKGDVTWVQILDEEIYEAYVEEDETRLREEMIQFAAVAVAWIEDLDRRKVAAKA